ncbi:conserved domain protein [delta proteobacterium NaphS2]|nr:conserved domain protein [delta proteobacterium NaphS2]
MKFQFFLYALRWHLQNANKRSYLKNQEDLKDFLHFDTPQEFGRCS